MGCKSLWRRSIVRHFSNALSLSAVIGALVGVGCGTQPSDAVSKTTSPLELPIVDCQTAQAKCLLGSKSPQDALQCNDTFGKCLIAAGPKLANIGVTLVDCQAKAQQCVLKGGVAAVANCRMQFQSCIDEAGDSDAGVSTPSQPGTGLPGLPGANGGLPAFPGFPGAGVGGTLPGFPGGGLPGAGLPGGGLLGGTPGATCFTSLTACVRGGTRPADCATQARACLGGQGAAGAAAPSVGAAGAAPSESTTP
jgi:hypothetical protein